MRRFFKPGSILLLATLLSQFPSPTLLAQQQPPPGLQNAATPQATPALNRPRSAQLISLIQTTVAPDCWVPFSTQAAAAGNPGSAEAQLINAIHTHVAAATWDINGGLGTIHTLPW